MGIRKVNEIKTEENPHKVDVRKLYDNYKNGALISLVKAHKLSSQAKLL